MRIIPFEINIERAEMKITSVDTFEIQLLHFDWPDGNTCLLGCGWYQGIFWYDIFFWWAIRNRLLPKISERFE